MGGGDVGRLEGEEEEEEDAHRPKPPTRSVEDLAMSLVASRALSRGFISLLEEILCCDPQACAAEQQ